MFAHEYFMSNIGGVLTLLEFRVHIINECSVLAGNWEIDLDAEIHLNMYCE